MRCVGNRYRLDERVGQGGMAVVWRGYDLVLRRTVAVKVWSPAGDPEPASARRMCDEAVALAGLHHPRIARLLDYGEQEAWGQTTPYLVLEFVDGETLAARLSRGPLPWTAAAHVCAQVAEALAAVHAAGLVHRDVKPANVMLSPDGVRVLDFGVAASAGHETLDTSGRVWGTLPYLPPEQLRGGPALPAGDVYGLGLLLGEALTGRRRRRREGTAPVTELPHEPGRPDAVVALHRRCLSRRPEDRPTAAEAAVALRAVAAETLRPRPVRPTWPPRRLLRPTAIAAGTVAVLAVPVASGLVSERSPGEMGSAAVDNAPADVCAARYRAERRADGTFAATLTVTTTDSSPWRERRLTFAVPDGHRLTEVRPAAE